MRFVARAVGNMPRETRRLRCYLVKCAVSGYFFPYTASASYPHHCWTTYLTFLLISTCDCERRKSLLMVVSVRLQPAIFFPFFTSLAILL